MPVRTVRDSHSSYWYNMGTSLHMPNVKHQFTSTQLCHPRIVPNVQVSNVALPFSSNFSRTERKPHPRGQTNCHCCWEPCPVCTQAGISRAPFRFSPPRENRITLVKNHPFLCFFAGATPVSGPQMDCSDVPAQWFHQGRVRAILAQVRG